MPVDHQSAHSFRQFWEDTCHDKLSRLKARASRLAGGKFDVAEDFLQETICLALSCSKNPAEIQTTPLNYLFAIMRNVRNDRWNKENTANVESLDALMNTAQHPTVEPDVLRIFDHEERSARFDDQHGPLTEREDLLLTLHLKGFKNHEIAAQLHEDVKVTRYDLNAVKSKVRYRLKKAKTRTAKSGK